MMTVRGAGSGRRASVPEQRDEPLRVKSRGSGAAGRA